MAIKFPLQLATLFGIVVSVYSQYNFPCENNTGINPEWNAHITMSCEDVQAMEPIHIQFRAENSGTNRFDIFFRFNCSNETHYEVSETVDLYKKDRTVEYSLIGEVLSKLSANVSCVTFGCYLSSDDNWQNLESTGYLLDASLSNECLLSLSEPTAITSTSEPINTSDHTANGTNTTEPTNTSDYPADHANTTREATSTSSHTTDGSSTIPEPTSDSINTLSEATDHIPDKLIATTVTTIIGTILIISLVGTTVIVLSVCTYSTRAKIKRERILNELRTGYGLQERMEVQWYDENVNTNLSLPKSCSILSIDFSPMYCHIQGTLDNISMVSDIHSTLCLDINETLALEQRSCTNNSKSQDTEKYQPTLSQSTPYSSSSGHVYTHLSSKCTSENVSDGGSKETLPALPIIDKEHICDQPYVSPLDPKEDLGSMEILDEKKTTRCKLSNLYVHPLAYTSNRAITMDETDQSDAESDSEGGYIQLEELKAKLHNRNSNAQNQNNAPPNMEHQAEADCDQGVGYIQIHEVLNHMHAQQRDKL